MLGLFLTIALVGSLFFFLLDSGILYFLLSSIGMNFSLSPEQGEIFTAVLIVFITMFILLATFAFFVIGVGLQYFSNLEVSEANTLMEKIERIQTRKVIRGLEREG